MVLDWVRWSYVCKSKRFGGLGVRNLRLVNLALFCKWTWRLILVVQVYGWISSLLDMELFRLLLSREEELSLLAPRLLDVKGCLS